MIDRELITLAGGVVMAGFRGTTAGAGSAIARQVRDLQLAGVILFDRDAALGTGGRNITGPVQLAELARELRAARRDLLIAVDQEGGRVARLNPGCGFAAFPGHAALGAGRDPASTHHAAAAIAAECAAAGINVNFAPVVDLNTHPANPIIGALGRSFSADPQAVAAHAAAFIDAHRAHGVLTALKHFPGHGSSRGDTHLQSVDITATFDERELLPYRELIAADRADMIMAGHLTHRDLDAQLPASLSPQIIGRLLRCELGFGGVVVTDCLEMAAISGRYALRESVSLALNAGVDLLLFGNNSALYSEDKPEQVVAAVIDAVRRGDVSPGQLRQHAERVQALARRRGRGAVSQGLASA
jgi:beta-N-acetylhexosaminidase